MDRSPPTTKGSLLGDSSVVGEKMEKKERVGREDARWTGRMSSLGGSCQSHPQYVYCLGRSVDVDLYS